MSLTVTIDGTERDYGQVSLQRATSEARDTPEATISGVGQDVRAGESVVIAHGGTQLFTGQVARVRVSQRGQRRITAEHDLAVLFRETVDIAGENTAENVLQEAITQADTSATLNYVGTDTALGDTYEADDRKVKRIFQDMLDRTGRLYRVDNPDTIVVEEPGDRGTITVDTTTDTAAVREFDPGDVRTVINDVTVNGTGGELVTGRATDSTSINNFGRRTGNSPYNVDYIRTESEAEDYAQELLVPEPLASIDVTVSSSVTDVVSDRSNFTLEVTDPSRGISAETFTIEEQTNNSSGSATFSAGEGAFSSLDETNRRSKSRDDLAEPGSVYGEDRIGDESITEQKLEDLSVSIQKIQDEAVAEAKVRQNAITETKVDDNAISTPKLQAGSVVTGTLDSAAVTAIKIDADAVEAGKIAADAVGAREVIANAITADEIDVLDLTAGQISIGDFTFTETSEGTALEPSSDGTGVVGLSNTRLNVVNSINADFEALFTDTFTCDNDFDFGGTMRPQSPGTGLIGTTNDPFDAMVAGNFITSTPEPLEGVDAAEITDYTWRQPPEYCAQRKATASDDREYRYQNPGSGIDLPHITNYLFEVCKDQQSQIRELRERLSALEDKVD